MRFHIISIVAGCLLYGIAYPMQNSSIIEKEKFKILINPILEQAKILVEKYREDKNQPKPIIAIAGCSAVGKSFFTRRLAKLLQEERIKVKILKADDFLTKPLEFTLLKEKLKAIH